MTSIAPWEIWLVMGVAGIGTLALRYSFIALLKRSGTEIPDLARRVLRLIPAAVFASLIAPSLTHPAAAFDPWSERMLAGLVAALVAWRTKNVLATIAVGMAVLWVLQSIS
jgi:branched-subunit amino acid transport protein